MDGVISVALCGDCGEPHGECPHTWACESCGAVYTEHTPECTLSPSVPGPRAARADLKREYDKIKSSLGSAPVIPTQRRDQHADVEIATPSKMQVALSKRVEQVMDKWLDFRLDIDDVKIDHARHVAIGRFVRNHDEHTIEVLVHHMSVVIVCRHQAIVDPSGIVYVAGDAPAYCDACAPAATEEDEPIVHVRRGEVERALEHLLLGGVDNVHSNGAMLSPPDDDEQG